MPYLTNYSFKIMNTKQIGNLTELKCITYLYELGYSVSIPFGNSDKYDIILDINNKLYKIQVKHCKEIIDEHNNIVAISFKCVWISHNSKGYKRRKYTNNDVDLFATYYNNQCYLIPLSECSNEKILRIKPCKNNQQKGINNIKNYEAERVISRL